jgi:hypothetical protein
MTVFLLFLSMQVARLIPLLIGIIRWKKIDPSYKPFIVLLALGLINETISYVLIKTIGTNVIPFNIFQIVECLVILYQFRVWGFFRKNYYFYGAAFAFITFWITQNLVFKGIFNFHPYFRVFYAFTIVLIILNRIIYVANENMNVFRNAKFIISTGFVIFFIYQILFEGALIANTTVEEQKRNIFIKLFMFMDIIMNIIYIWAMYIAPGKRDFAWNKNT